MPNTYDLTGKVAIVTGGAKGIGRAIVDRLQASGAGVWVWDFNEVRIHGARSSIVDISQPEQIAKCLAEAGDSRIDILINDAGYLGRCQPFSEHSLQDWHQIVNVNLIGTMQVTQAALPYMARHGGGRIINMGSLAGKEGLANLAAYSAASAGVISFTKALSREVIGQNIYVNCVAPGPIDTDMIRNLGTEVVDNMISDSPMKRLGSAEEVAHLVVWFNTGAIFDMSGGRARC